MFYIALVSAQHGHKAGYATTLGVATGLLFIGLLAAFGFSAIVAENAIYYEVIRWAGILYLFWLAYDTWQDTAIEFEASETEQVLRESFMRGFITNILNPKAFLFYISILPLFVPTEGAYRSQAIWLTGVYVAIATGVHSAIVLGAGSISDQLQKPERRRAAGCGFAIMLVFVAIWTFFKTAR